MRVSAVVFLRAINVGGANRCRPAELARQLPKFDIVNIGAVGTFVVRAQVSESTLRAAIAKKLPFRCEIIIVPSKSIVDLAGSDPFAGQPSGSEITRFVSVLHKRPENLAFSLPLALPSEKDWLLKIVAIRDRFVIGVYRRQMKAIGYLGKIEKLIGQSGTVRNWNTIEKVLKVLSNG